LKQDPDRADASLRVAILLDQQGKFAQAQEYYRRVQTVQPRNADLHCNLGYSLYLQGRLSEAETALRQAITLNPDHRRAHNNLGLVLASQGQQDEALTEFRRAGCGEVDAHINLAFTLTLQSRLPEARSHYEQALAADPASASAKKGLQELNHLMARTEDGRKKASHTAAARPGGNQRLPDGAQLAPAFLAEKQQSNSNRPALP
jgi:Tfp pilus assembly protein PilF